MCRVVIFYDYDFTHLNIYTFSVLKLINEIILYFIQNITIIYHL